MWKNYLITAYRNLVRNKLFTGINVIGLAMGLAAFMIILMFVRQELTYDRFWADSDRIFRVEARYSFDNQDDRVSQAAPRPVLPLMEARYAEIEATARFLRFNMQVRVDGSLTEMPTMFVEGDLFSVFDYTFLEGSAEAALATTRGVVLPESEAKRLLGQGPYLGREVAIMFGETNSYVVTGVVRDLPVDTALVNAAMVPLVLSDFEGARWFNDSWHFAIMESYMKLSSARAAETIRADLPALVEEHTERQQGGTETAGRHTTLSLQALHDIHTNPDYGRDPVVMYGFVGIAALILLIAVMNFLNLSMARTAYRAREVAVRKVVGAHRSQILQQFLAESVVLAGIALVVAFAILEFSLVYVRSMLRAFVELGTVNDPMLFGFLIGLGLLVGLSAGSLHASYFALLDPVKPLKGQVSADGGAAKLRFTLVLMQFAISIGLMSSALIVALQTDYARSMSLGFSTDGLWIVSGSSSGAGQQDQLKTELLQHPSITAVGRASDVPTRESEDRIAMRRPADGVEVILDGLPIDAGFFDAFDIPLLAGRMVSEDRPSDVIRTREDRAYKVAVNVIVNKLGAETLGFAYPAEAVGQTVDTNLTQAHPVAITIVGVTDDFHFDSARNVIRPGIYYLDPLRMSEMAVRFNPAERDAALAHLRDIWAGLYPNRMLRWWDMSDLVGAQYEDDEALMNMLFVFTGLAVAISALGLFGLAAFSAERRTREIGVRKVLGARPIQLVALLSWQFSKPILIGALIAIPAAFLLVQDWLEGFAYKIPLTPWPFLAVVVAALLIGALTVSGYAIKAARTRPVDALRYE